MKRIFAFLVFCVALTVMAQKPEADMILGSYRIATITCNDTAVIKVTKTSKGLYQGRITWLNHPTNDDGTKRNDAANKDSKLRSRTYDQIFLFWNLAYKDGEWVDGKLYDPFSGKNFSVKFKLDANGSDLEARYYKGVPTLGITRTWTRVK